jgi:hypothetical protein
MQSDLEQEIFEEEVTFQSSIIAGLVQLSESPIQPLEVDASVPFSEDQASFEGMGWLRCVISVQDWLRLDETLTPSDGVSESVNKLMTGLGSVDHSNLFTVTTDDRIKLTVKGLELLRDRIERASGNMELFLEKLEESSLVEASQHWLDAWEEPIVSEVTGNIVARADIWNIKDFAYKASTGKLELNPSYQRGDVWPTKDAQLLIESIVKGIPLPSIIILKPQKIDAPFEVVDGKQRLTAILRFIGTHPAAIQRVKEADLAFPNFQLKTLFESDYSKFRKAWANAKGETLTASKEKEYYFPFKLSTSSISLNGPLESLQGKYYDQIRDLSVKVGGEAILVNELFEQAAEYKIPVIVYNKADPKQIHQVFSLYNKQGKHLNAEEIRNAVYHEIDLMRALAIAAGDGNIENSNTDFLQPISDEVLSIKNLLEGYKISDVRYKRTKILAWLCSVMVSDFKSDPSAAVPTYRLLSTARQIDHMLDLIESDQSNSMRHHDRINDLLKLVYTGMKAHQPSDSWNEKFKNKSGGNWQELQLIGSLLGVSLAAVVLGDSTEEKLDENEAAIQEKSASATWKRPSKTQTDRQWKFIAFIALSVLDELGVSASDVDEQLLSRFGRSPIPALQHFAQFNLV